MNRCKGECRCGQTKVILKLPDMLTQYVPRQCDCDFCMARNVLYLSHPDGELTIKSSSLISDQQGSNQAEFLSCRHCHTVIAATVLSGDHLIGAVNSTLLIDFNLLQPAAVASPKKLAAKDKLTRWQSLWLKITLENS